MSLLAYGPGTYKKASAAAYAQWSGAKIVNYSPFGNYHSTQQKQFIQRTSDGNYVAAWREGSSSPNYDLYAQKFDNNGNLMWTSGWSDIEISGLSGYEPYSDIVDMEADASGGTYIAFTRYSTTGPVYDVWVGRYNGSNGSALCKTNLYGSGGDLQETAIQLAPDGSGGVFAVWKENNTAKIQMTHLNDTCSVDAGWNTGGSGTYRAVNLFTGTNVWYPEIFESGTGNYIVTFYDGSAVEELRAIKVQGSNGSILWTNAAGSVPFAYEHTSSPDGAGGVILAYTNGSGSPQTEIFATRLAPADGSVVWGPISLGTGSSVYDPQMVPNTTSGTTDGAIIVWTTTNYSTGQLYGQKITAAGTKQWNRGNPLSIINTDASLAPFGDWHGAQSDNSGGIFVGYLKNSFIGGNKIVGVQRVLSDGTRDYGNGGYDLTMLNYTLSYNWPDIAYDGDDGVMMVYSDNNVFNGGWNTYAQYVAGSAPPPVIDYVDPYYSYINASNVFVYIEGSNLADVETTTIGGAPCSLIQKADTFYGCEIANIPNLPNQWVDVYMETPTGNSGDSGDGLFYIYGTPVITSMAPESGSAVGGEVVTIEGSGFGEQTAVDFGGEPAMIQYYEFNLLEVIVPAGTAGQTVNVTLTNPGDYTAIAGEYEYLVPAVICIPGPGETCGEINIGCGAGEVTIAASEGATFDTRTTSFYNDPTNAALTGADMTIDLIDTRTYDPGTEPDETCGDGATVQIQSTGLTKDGLGVPPILDMSLNTAPTMACVGLCGPSDISEVATLQNSTGSISTAKDVIVTSEAFSGTIRTTFSGTDLEVVRPGAVIPQGNYAGVITFTQL